LRHGITQVEQRRRRGVSGYGTAVDNAESGHAQPLERLLAAQHAARIRHKGRHIRLEDAQVRRRSQQRARESGAAPNVLRQEHRVAPVLVKVDGAQLTQRDGVLFHHRNQRLVTDGAASARYVQRDQLAAGTRRCCFEHRAVDFDRDAAGLAQVQMQPRAAGRKRVAPAPTHTGGAGTRICRQQRKDAQRKRGRHARTQVMLRRLLCHGVDEARSA
jgi:hypothetical protein